MHIRRLKKAVLAVTLVALAACGSDSTGPGDVSAEEALSSLARGFSGSGASLPFGISPAVLGNAGSLGQIDVTIGGAAHTMYALGSRVTYPSGTCFEALFIIPSVTFPPGECTPPPLGLALVMWQTRSGSRPPERTVFLSADVGTVDFGFDEFDDLPPGPGPVRFPVFAGFYVTDGGDFWVTIGGSLTSNVTATSQTCAVTPPPFAKSSTCHVASFDESGSITFQKLDFSFLGTPGAALAVQTTELVIPRQTILGIVQAITETQPVTIPGPWDY